MDIIGVLTGTDRPRKYWNDLKTKLIKEDYTEVSEKIGQIIEACVELKSCHSELSAAWMQTMRRI